MRLPESDSYREIFLEDRPLLDVRAPIEYAAGAFPNAHNLPLLDDRERHLVGICHKEKGGVAAVELGLELVRGELRERRIQAWCSFVACHPNAVLYCFRGGQRSRISQRWLASAGVDILRVRGGYKALRRFLLRTIDELAPQLSLRVLSGRTGCGKTVVLQRLERRIDLEGLAHHRGSAFGGYLKRQPTQVDFENPLAIAMLRLHQACPDPIVVENESRNVGSRTLPATFFEAMLAAPLYVLETPFEERVTNIRREYVEQELEVRGFATDPESAVLGVRAKLERDLAKISSRLGPQRTALVSDAMRVGWQTFAQDGDIRDHEAWIAILLRDYYDPMYDYQAERNRERILCRGDADTITAALRDRASTRSLSR